MSGFYREVMTQPDKLRIVLDEYKKNEYTLIRKAAEIILLANHVYFAGMGTSLNVADSIIKGISKKVGVSAYEAGDMIELPELVRDNDVVILISQSGESIELYKLFNVLKKKNVKIIGITNNAESMLAKNCDIPLLLYAGEEKSITNKTFTNTLAVLYMIEYILNNKAIDELDRILNNAADEMDHIINDRELEIKKWADFLAPSDVIHFISNGDAAKVLSKQSALIYMEGASCAARAFTVGAFRHGPIEICSDSHRAVLYSSEEHGNERIVNLVNEIKNYGSKSIVVSNQKIDYENVFYIDNKYEEAFAMEASIFMEILLSEVAQKRGLVAGEFHITDKICKKE